MIRLLFWIPVFLLPSFQLLRLFALPAPNTVFLFLPWLVELARGRLMHKGILAFIACLFSLSLHAYLTNSSSLIFWALLLTPLIFVASIQLKFIDPRTAADLLAVVAVINAVFCLIQLYSPSFGISNINEGYDVSEHNVSTLIKVLPFLPSFGRLRGIYNENGPMVLYLLLHTVFLVKIFASSLLTQLSLRRRVFYSLAIVLNLIGIFFTGSKTTVISAPVLLILWLSTRRTPLSRLSIWMRQSCSAYPLLSFLAVYIIVFSLINGIPYLIEYLLDVVLQGFVGIEMRLTTDALRFTLFSDEGLLPTSEGETLADSLSAYHLYTYAFGSLLSSLIISSYLYFIVRYSSSSFYIIITLLALLISGSFLLPFYSQLVVLSTYDLASYSVLPLTCQRTILPHLNVDQSSNEYA